MPYTRMCHGQLPGPCSAAWAVNELATGSGSIPVMWTSTLPLIAAPPPRMRVPVGQYAVADFTSALSVALTAETLTVSNVEAAAGAATATTPPTASVTTAPT